ncbi:MAG: hypothetical protein H6552_03415 [Chitinophagales bacterium]|nr:hypothetical protein [Chitinophagales bacterium]
MKLRLLVSAPAPEATTEEVTEDVAEYDPKRGEGEYDESNLQLAGLDAMATKEKQFLKQNVCLATTTDEKLVGQVGKLLLKEIQLIGL